MSKKVSLPLQAPKELTGEQADDWYRHRSFIARPLVLITTVDGSGTANVSVKTNLMTVSSMKCYAFCCSPEHHTHRNILETGEFVMNVPTEDILEKALKAAAITEKPCPSGVNEIERAGLTPIPSERVKPPRVKECVAHYECVLDWHEGDLIVGKVVAASVDQSLLDGTDNRKFVAIRGGDGYAVVGKTKKWPKSV